MPPIWPDGESVNFSMTSRTYAKDQPTNASLSPADDSDAWNNSTESHTFISSVSNKQSHSSSRLLRGFLSMKTMICTAQRQVCMNNRTARKLASMIKYIYGVVRYVLSRVTNIIPANMFIHIFTAILVTTGTLTLFLSPSFRSKLSEMRERPESLQNGILDAMAWSSDKFAVVTANASSNSCSEKYFRCEFYWASDTDDASNTQNTAYCSAYVCKGMTVIVTVLPQTCSQSNRVGIGAMLKEIYAKPVYSCGNSGCGECSTLRYHSLEDGIVSFLQGCNEDDSCYGQIEVSLTKELPPTAVAVSSKVWGSAPWGGFRGGQFSQGVARVSSPLGKPYLIASMAAGAFKSSPAVSSTKVAYIGSEDKNIYAVTSKDISIIVWKYLTGGKIQGSPALSPNELTVYVGSGDHYLYAIDTAAGTLNWRYKTDGELSSSPTLGIDTSIAYAGDILDAPGILYVGCSDGHLYAISTAGDLKWRFSTVIPLDVAVSGSIRSSPSVSPDDSVIYFGCDNSILYAVSKTGLLKWHYRTNGGITSSPAISSDGQTLYFGSSDMHLYALSNTGILKWRYFADSPILSSCSLFEGVIYFTTTTRSAEIIVPPAPPKEKKNSKSAGGNSGSSSTSTSKNHKKGGVKERLLRGDDVIVKKEGTSLKNDERVLITVPRPNPFVPPPRYEGGGLLAVSSRGELLWRYSIPLGSQSSPLFTADGSLVLGAEDGFLYKASSAGSLIWKYDASDPISSSPGIDEDGAIYIGTLGKTGGTGQFLVVGADTSRADSLHAIPDQPAVKLDWTCSADSFSSVQNRRLAAAKTCESVSSAGGLSCLPGLAEYIGNGVDITLQRNDPRFLKSRIFDFRTLDGKEKLRGVEYTSPPGDQIKVTEMEDIEITNPLYSGAFRGVMEYTNQQANSYSVSTDNILGNILGNIPHETIASAMANSTGTWTSHSQIPIARSVSINAAKGKGTLLNVATYSHTKYDLLPQSTTGQSCSQSYSEDVENLDTEYVAEEYLSFVKSYGTHVIIGVTFGGSITSETSYDPCTAKRGSKYSTPSEVFENYKKELGDFIVYGRQSEISFLGHVNRRDAMAVCGGDENIFRGESKTPFATWTKSTQDPGSDLCAVVLHLVPLYSTILPDDSRRPFVEAAVTNYMYKAKNFASLNTTQISSCQIPLVLGQK